jgi:ribonuclease P protein component
LTRRAEFVRVAKGPRHAAASCVVQARARPDGAGVRFGVTATRKTGGAVVRNRAKRRLREVARQLLPRLGQPGVDYVFIARQQTATAPWGSLLDDVEKALIRLAPTAADRADGSASPSRGRR